MTNGVLDGKVIVVTGAGSGIGAVLAQRAHASGARVALLGRTEETLQETASKCSGGSGEVLVQTCDISQPASVSHAVDKIVSQWGTIDGLVNNAAVFHVAHILEVLPEDWERVLSINLSGVVYMTQAVGRVMAKNGSGSIVNMSSADGHLGEFNSVCYNTPKSALFGLTRSSALDLGPLGIRCNSVSPGYVDGTPMAGENEDSGVESSSLSSLLRDWDRVPIRRMVTLEEVSDTCAFLLSDGATGISGADIRVDGGLTTNLYAMEPIPETGAAETEKRTLERIRAAL